MGVLSLTRGGLSQAHSRDHRLLCCPWSWCSAPDVGQNHGFIPTQSLTHRQMWWEMRFLGVANLAYIWTAFKQEVRSWSEGSRKKNREGLWCNGKDLQGLCCSMVKNFENGIKEDVRDRGEPYEKISLIHSKLSHAILITLRKNWWIWLFKCYTQFSFSSCFLVFASGLSLYLHQSR